jgi:hypothetical protein
MVIAVVIEPWERPDISRPLGNICQEPNMGVQVDNICN